MRVPGTASNALQAANVLPLKVLELLLTAFDAAYVQVHGPGTRHMKNAFKAGATMDKIMEVLKLGVVDGVEICNLGVTILAEELEREALRSHAAA